MMSDDTFFFSLVYSIDVLIFIHHRIMEPDVLTFPCAWQAWAPAERYELRL